MTKEDKRDEDGSARVDGSDSRLQRGWYPVIGGGTSILLIFIAVSLVRGTVPFAFAPVFILFVLGMVAGSAYVMRTLLAEQ